MREKKINKDDYAKCTGCNNGIKKVVCNRCNGKGKEKPNDRTGKNCILCRGQGYVYDKCKICKGTGVIVDWIQTILD